MAWLDQFPGMTTVEERTERAWRLPVGAASPLWGAFGAAAGAGVAWWWLTSWARAVNIEAMAALKLRPVPAPRRIEVIAEEPPPDSAPEPELEAEAVVADEVEPASPAQPDDLTRMVGIGPKLAEALAARGVTRFADIAAWTEADLAEVDTALSLKGRAVREAWVDQAKQLAEEG